MDINVKLPSVVYKYRRWDNSYHRRIIDNNEVFFSAPRDFEDPLDCNPPVTYPQGHDLFVFFLNYSLLNNERYNWVEHVLYASNQCKSSPLSIPYELKRIEDNNKDVFNQHFGVLCLTEDPCNEYMWNEYADFHKGFCVGFNTQMLFESVKCGCGPVQYTDPLPYIDFAKDTLDSKIIKTVFYKEKKWENEKEYRFHKMWQKGELVNRNCKLKDYTIVEVVVGKNMTANNKQELKDLVKVKYPNAVLKEEI